MKFENTEVWGFEHAIRCDKVYFMNEFLEESRFISTDKYLEIADRYEKILDKLDEALKTKESRGIKKLNFQRR